MSILPLTVPPKKLAQTISSTATSFKLNNITGWNGNDLTPADFGTEAFIVFVNSTRTQIEIMKIDPTTIADPSITILARGLEYLGGEVSDPSRQYAWTSNDTTVQLGTDAPQLFRDFMAASNPATITAQHTYDVLPESAEIPTDPEDFATKQYVDGLTEPAIVVPTTQVAHGFVVGDVIRISGVNTFTKAQADSPVNAEAVGIVTNVIDVDTFEYTTEGVVTSGVPVFAAGTVLWLSPTVAGALTDTEPTTIGQVQYPLAVISESGLKMIFHKFRPAVINTISGNPIASETVAGMVEQATLAQFQAKTDVGETGAPLFVRPSHIPDPTPDANWVQIGVLTVPGGNVNNVEVPSFAGYKHIWLLGTLIVDRPDSSGNSVYAQTSIDGGSTWMGTDSYLAYIGSPTADNIFIKSNGIGTVYISIKIEFVNSTLPWKPTMTIAADGPYTYSPITASPIDALRVVVSGSHWFRAGETINLYGIPA